jgi:exosome complex exonuclease DIS3/RRP44
LFFFYQTLSFLSFQNQTQQAGSVVFHSFDPVTVRCSLDSTNVQHEKLVFQLVKPFIEGFSVKAVEDEKDEEAAAIGKRKTEDQEAVTASAAGNKKKKNNKKMKK